MSGGRRAWLAAHRVLPPLVFAAGASLFIATLAPGLVFGDPSEYTLMPHLWAVLHPPGYALMTLLVKTWQSLVPVGELAYRTNLLSATAGATAGLMTYFAVVNLWPDAAPEAPWAGALAAGSLYTAANFWQHAIHTNAHIITATLASIAIALLLRWSATGDSKWLYAFGLVAGLSVTHHPLLVFGFPAYGVFILLHRPKFVTLLKVAALGIAGLLPWLYFPIRASILPPPLFGSAGLNTFEGFLNLVLARGLTNVNLFHFGLEEQWHRLIVFWALLRLQFFLPVMALAALGLAWLARHRWQAAALLLLHVSVNLAFTLNTVQDVMAYLLVPLVSIAMAAGAGALALANVARHRLGSRAGGALSAALLIFPLINAVWLAPRISLRQLRAADQYVESVARHFGGRGEQAVLLSDWEHATPLWYHQHVNGLALDPADVTVVYVNKPFIDAVWENIDRGPIYLLEYNREVINTGFRLRAEGLFYRLELPPAVSVPPIASETAVTFGEVELLGYDVLARSVRAGDTVPIILYVRAPQTTDQFIHPFATLGQWQFRFTTDSRWLTPYWQAGEVMAERWDVIVPLEAAGGEYPLEIGFTNLATGEDYAPRVSLGVVEVQARSITVPPVAANFGQRVGLEWARAWVSGGRAQVAPWSDPLVVRAGDSIEIRLQWRALASPESSYTVFLHLLDAGDGLVASEDYTPLGGAFPTLLWFPKWVEGQSVVDPYSLEVPADTPPGDYYIETGLYGLRSVVRAPAFDANGNLAGDRFVLGWISVTQR